MYLGVVFTLQVYRVWSVAVPRGTWVMDKVLTAV